jgi:hypothetical protein
LRAQTRPARPHLGFHLGAQTISQMTTATQEFIVRGQPYRAAYLRDKDEFRIYDCGNLPVARLASQDMALALAEFLNGERLPTHAESTLRTP